MLIEGSVSDGQSVTVVGFLLTLGGAFCWASGNIFNKKIMLLPERPPIMSLVVWSALVPIVPFFIASYLFEGIDTIQQSLAAINMTTVLSLVYLAFLSTIVGYGLWGTLLGRYEAWRVAPLSLLVPVVGMASAALFLDETLSLTQISGAALVMAGLYINVFGLKIRYRMRKASSN